MADINSVSDALYEAVINRMNITWKPDERTAQNIRNAIEEAQDYLRKYAGNPVLSFESGELRGLLIDCAYYFAYSKRAEFAKDYASELISLRMEEGFGCGKDID